MKARSIEVKLREFFLGQTPITQAQWKVVAGWEKVELDLNSDPASSRARIGRWSR